MPTYEYECQGCGYKFEVFQSIKSDPVKQCPKCHKDKAKRLISAGAGVIFRGSGFYATDYKKGHKSQVTSQKFGKSVPKCSNAGSRPACASCEGGKPKDD
jgi:putative FmdB family regulatory protein